MQLSFVCAWPKLRREWIPGAKIHTVFTVLYCTMALTVGHDPARATKRAYVRYLLKSDKNSLDLTSTRLDCLKRIRHTQELKFELTGLKVSCFFHKVNFFSFTLKKKGRALHVWPFMSIPCTSRLGTITSHILFKTWKALQASPYWHVNIWVHHQK